MSSVLQKALKGDFLPVRRKVTVTLVDGAAATTFPLNGGEVLIGARAHTKTAIPGTPTNCNLRIGSAANGQQYVADVDVKAAGMLSLTLVAAAHTAADNGDATAYVTVASSGGTAASQDGDVILWLEIIKPAF